MPTTPNFNVTTPTVGGDADTWGQINNDALDGLDGFVWANQQALAGKLSLTGGTLTGALIGTTASFPDGVTSTTGFTGPLTGAVTGNASTATVLQTARNFSLTGIVTASAVSFNGSGNVALSTAIADGALTIAKTSGLQTALNGKEPTLDADRKRKITISTADPSGGADGDIWFKYTA